MSVDPCGCGRIGVTEAGGDGGDRDAGVDHQRGVRMAQTVDGDVRQIIRFDEIAEPTADGVRVDGCTVRFREKPVAICPSITHTQAALSLPPLILLEKLDGNSRRFDVACRACVLGGIGDDALVRDVERRAGDPND